MSLVTLRHLRTPLDLPLALFFVSGLIGVWASYDPATSWRKFAMIVAAVALYYVLVGLRAAPKLLETFVWLFLFGCCALALYFVTQHDYAAHPGKFDFITAIGLTLNRITPQLGLHVFDPNITAGALEIALPLAAALAASQKSKIKRQKENTRNQNVISLSPDLLVSLSACAIIALGLLMTSSRGAWLALGIVGVIAVLTVAAKDVLRRYALPIGVIAVLVTLIVLMRLGDRFMPALESILGAIPAGDTAVSRMELWWQGWGLVQDYYFTGSGLGVFPMVLSTYALLIDVPFLTHVHNLFLQIWLEQGLLGFVAFVWIVVEFYLWAWRTVGSRRSTVDSRQSIVNSQQSDAFEDPSPVTYHLSPFTLFWGGIAAVTVMLLHGTVDVLLYSSRGLPLLLMPFALAVDCENTEYGIQITEGEKKSGKLKRGAARVAAYCLMLTAFCLVLLSSPFQAMIFANMGSVEQTRIELGQYHWPDRLVGEIRSDPKLSSNFQPAISNFQRALWFDAGNVTANQRLAAMAGATHGR